ncbi:MAG: hypothetical protein Q9224_007184, partial [Gallowayella concinna]
RIAQAQCPASNSEDDEPITPRNNERRYNGFNGTPQHENFSSPIVLINADEGDKVESDGRGRARRLRPTIELTSTNKDDGQGHRTRFSKGDRNNAQVKHPSSKSAVSISSDDDSEPIPLKSTDRRGRRGRGSPKTPQRSTRNPPTPRTGLPFLQGGSTGSAPINRSRKDTAVTPTRSSKRATLSRHQSAQPIKRSGGSSPRSRQHVESNADDSVDSLMDELRSSRKDSAEDLPEALNSGKDSSDDAVKRSRRRKILPVSSSSSVHGSKPVERKQQYREAFQNDGKREALTRTKRPAAKRSARKKQLELLRKRRAGEEVHPSSNDDDLEIGEPDTDPSTDIDDREEDSDPATERIRRAIPPNLDEYEEDFVDDDADDSTLGQPADIASIPLEFTRHAHKKPAEHFKDVVEWLVHNKINPAFKRDDPIYTNA